MRLDEAVGRAAIGDHSALGDARAALPPAAPLRTILTGSGAAPFAAALIVSGAALQLADGSCVPVEERLLENGALDLAGARAISTQGASGASDAPDGQRASAWTGQGTGIALSLQLRRGRIADAAAAIAGIAPYPLRARQLEGALRGRARSPRLFDIAAETARIEAQPFGVGELLDDDRLDQLAAAARTALELALRRGRSAP